ncbi:1,6-anhydro-N-acetylmuramyl-L-alanine amidase AmpD [Parathalassolituus penaei]|uniref:1,6-anhydro-N-acetylmuramyl-L-alanine amidase AmpD n=1 Tax=Parathalassolituus penaei TaxID=2997323 RepID=A0A9X3EB36_9GAMM|nr:1,6-anhydro-N-acetylmuramyl-L-alanine amidase AmpD [Parathalassolituus penaei]MCY0964289.1 1,6-anhydro-N-acetylmuramyl-L-alanine amidase AmpD [Parathalassolituus penaei]
MKLVNGVLDEAVWCPSPNFGPRPAAEVSLLVIHNISLPPGQFGTGCVQRFFQNCLDTSEHPWFANIEGVQVSSHWLIERDGSLFQFVNANDRAWHAGVSTFDGRNNCNDFSLGIELEGTDDQAYTEQQYEVLVAMIAAIREAYPLITPDRITGHEHIAPGRKTDPGPAFDWARLRAGITTGDV